MENLVAMIESIQLNRFSTGAIVYDIDSNNYAIVLDGDWGTVADPESVVVRLFGNNIAALQISNRKLLPTGRICDLKNIMNVLSEGKE